MPFYYYIGIAYLVIINVVTLVMYVKEAEDPSNRLSAVSIPCAARISACARMISCASSSIEHKLAMISRFDISDLLCSADYSVTSSSIPLSIRISLTFSLSRRGTCA